MLTASQILRVLTKDGRHKKTKLTTIEKKGEKREHEQTMTYEYGMYEQCKMETKKRSYVNEKNTRRQKKRKSEKKKKEETKSKSYDMPGFDPGTSRL